jgi:hypothetical protein
LDGLYGNASVLTRIQQAGLGYLTRARDYQLLTHPKVQARLACPCDLELVHPETVLADEDVEQDPDRWCSYTPHGQECWQIVSQWVWNLRLELGHVQQHPEMRHTRLVEDAAPQSATMPALPEPQLDEPVEEEVVENYGPGVG